MTLDILKSVIKIFEKFVSLFENLCLTCSFFILNKNYIFVASGSGDASGATGPPLPVASTGRGSARGKRILPADIFVTKPSHIQDKRGEQ